MPFVSALLVPTSAFFAPELIEALFAPTGIFVIFVAQRVL
jgi:hypothetical protein